MAKKLTLAAAPQAEVVLHDPAHDAGDRIYRLVPLTRDVKHRLRDVQDEVDAVIKPLEDGEKLTHDDEDRVSRLLCDQLSLVLRGGDGAPDAGDLLYDGYMEGRVTDDQIGALYADVFGSAADPT